VRTPLVRNGADAKISGGGHTLVNVHIEMMYQICMDYNGLSDTGAMAAHEIRFWYNGLRARLHKDTKPKR
jgi:hypothetical protein